MTLSMAAVLEVSTKSAASSMRSTAGKIQLGNVLAKKYGNAVQYMQYMQYIPVNKLQFFHNLLKMYGQNLDVPNSSTCLQPTRMRELVQPTQQGLEAYLVLIC